MMKKRGNQSRKKKGTGAPQRKADRVIPHPGMVSNVVQTDGHTLRFLALAGMPSSPFYVTFQNILDTVLRAATTTAVYQNYQMVKIREVRIWTPTPSASAAGLAAIANKCSVEFYGTNTGIQGDNLVYADLSMGIEPAFVRARPSSKSLAGFWQVTNAGAAFIMTCPPGSVIDLDVTFRTSFGGNNSATAGTGLSPGGLYVRGLDGLPAASTVLYPQAGDVA